MSLVYSQPAENSSLAVGPFAANSSTRTVQITSWKVRRLNGNNIPSLANWIVPSLTSIASSANRAHIFRPFYGYLPQSPYF
jgi:hypothetical protein